MYIASMLTHTEIILDWPRGRLGRYDVMAQDLNVDIALVAVWKHRGKIPSDYWADIASAAKRRRVKGVTLDVLAANRNNGRA